MPKCYNLGIFISYKVLSLVSNDYFQAIVIVPDDSLRKNKGVEFMSTKNIEGMKKIIEEKKKLSAQQGANDEKPNQRKVNKHKAFKTTKRGGFFDK